MCFFFFCLLGHPPCSVFCVYIDSLGIHTLPTYIIQSLFSLSPCTPLSCTSPTAIMLPPSTVFTCEARTRQFPVSVYFFCLPAPFFFSLLSNTLLFFFFVDPPPFFFEGKKNVDFLGSERSFLSSRYADWSRRTSAVDPSNFYYTRSRENL